MLMAPKNENEIERITDVNPDLVKKEEIKVMPREQMVIADKLENSRVISGLCRDHGHDEVLRARGHHRRVVCGHLQ